MSAAPRWNQAAGGESKRAKVSLYEVAPGRQLDFLRWLAAREEAAKTAGVPPIQVYAHLEGDRWDYMVLWPVTTAEQDKKLDEAAAREGPEDRLPRRAGVPRAAGRAHRHIAEGPTTAAALVALAK